jgi:hypothetical protein
MTELAKLLLEESQNERGVMDYLMETYEDLDKNREKWGSSLGFVDFFEMIEGSTTTIQAIYLEGKSRDLMDRVEVSEEFEISRNA